MNHERSPRCVKAYLTIMFKFDLLKSFNWCINFAYCSRLSLALATLGFNFIVFFYFCCWYLLTSIHHSRYPFFEETLDYVIGFATMFAPQSIPIPLSFVKLVLLMVTYPQIWYITTSTFVFLKTKMFLSDKH